MECICCRSSRANNTLVMTDYFKRQTPSSSYRTFELRQRGELNRSALSAVLRRALGFPLFLRLSHGLPRKPVHFLGCRDGRHFDAQTDEVFRQAIVSPGQMKGFLLCSYGFTSAPNYGANCLRRSSSPVPVLFCMIQHGRPVSGLDCVQRLHH